MVVNSSCLNIFHSILDFHLCEWCIDITMMFFHMFLETLFRDVDLLRYLGNPSKDK